MDLKRNNVSQARRPLQRRAFWWASIIVLCGLIVVIYSFAWRSPASAQKAPDTLPAAADACRPGLQGPNDVLAATTPAEPEANQPEHVPDDLVEMVSNEVIERAEDILPAEIRPHRAELLRTLSKETTLDSIENLPNYDDTRVECTIPFHKGLDSYNFLVQFIPKLSRVRKILEETAAGPNRDQIIDTLMQKFEHSAEGYRQVLSDFHKAMIEAGGSISSSEPLEFERRQVYGGAAAYLLTELRAYSALPLMSKVYYCEEKIPVSRLYVFYCMHLLAVDYPRARLSEQAQKSLDAYLEAAGDLPEPQILSVPVSNAAYHESDFRITIMRQDLLKKQARLQMRTYPLRLEKFERESWGTPQTDPHWLAVDPKIDELARQLKLFIEAAYPQNGTSEE